MKQKLAIGFGLIIAVLFLIQIPLNAQASPLGQYAQFSTPTPGADGRIIYIVKANDTCLGISILTGVSVDYIRQNNKLGENCVIFEGQELVIGMGGTAVPTITALVSPQPTSIIPTPTPFYGSAQVCVALYNDVNGDGLRQANTDEFDSYIADGTEPTIAGGAVSLTSLTGTYSQTLTTLAGLDPVCFPDVPEGSYTISAAVPEGYNPTTALTFQLAVKPGDQAFVSFGAQSREQTSQNNSTGKRSPLLGVLGAILILGGLGLGYYAFLLKK
jgi:hypothetical protein